jgi:hypothetical protein
MLHVNNRDGSEGVVALWNSLPATNEHFRIASKVLIFQASCQRNYYLYRPSLFSLSFDKLSFISIRRVCSVMLHFLIPLYSILNHSIIRLPAISLVQYHFDVITSDFYTPEETLSG